VRSDPRSADRAVLSTSSTGSSAVAGDSVLATRAADDVVTPTLAVGPGSVPASGPDARGPDAVHRIEGDVGKVFALLSRDPGRRNEFLGEISTLIDGLPLEDPDTLDGTLRMLAALARETGAKYASGVDGGGTTRESMPIVADQ
jgi:hypothetical protein